MSEKPVGDGDTRQGPDPHTPDMILPLCCLLSLWHVCITHSDIRQSYHSYTETLSLTHSLLLPLSFLHPITFDNSLSLPSTCIHTQGLSPALTVYIKQEDTHTQSLASLAAGSFSSSSTPLFAFRRSHHRLPLPCCGLIGEEKEQEGRHSGRGQRQKAHTHTTQEVVVKA